MLIATVNTPGNALDVEVAGSYAYVADYNGGLRIIDVSDPARPREVGAYDRLDYVWDVAVAGDYAYVANEGYGLRIIDVSVPGSPHGVGTFDTEGNTYDVAVAGDYAYLDAVGEFSCVPRTASFELLDIDYGPSPEHSGRPFDNSPTVFMPARPAPPCMKNVPSWTGLPKSL